MDQIIIILFSQGAAGEGDKETFIAAAHKLDLPYYQVGEFNREFGPINDNTENMNFMEWDNMILL